MSNQPAYWYVARTRHGAELSVRNRLTALGIEHFVPTRHRSSLCGKTLVEEPLLSCWIFLKASKADALDLVHHRGIKVDYIFDCATHRMMVVRNKEMENFRRVFDLAVDEGGLTDMPVAVGDRVRVIRGILMGVEGHVLELQGKYYVVVGLMNCLFARASVPRAWLEKIETK
jgi:transcription antitermination factor NusG